MAGMWRKSSRSANTNTCIELTSTLDRIRDSKNPAGQILGADAVALVRAIKVGQFD
ncbi:MAG: DUF397 domain-containing protein [Candidatus Dormibacteraceae bacterium]